MRSFLVPLNKLNTSLKFPNLVTSQLKKKKKWFPLDERGFGAQQLNQGHKAIFNLLGRITVYSETRFVRKLLLKDKASYTGFTTCYYLWSKKQKAKQRIAVMHLPYICLNWTNSKSFLVSFFSPSSGSLKGKYLLNKPWQEVNKDLLFVSFWSPVSLKSTKSLLWESLAWCALLVC